MVGGNSRGTSEGRVINTYRLFPNTNGPSSPVNYGGPFLAGVLFEVTTSGTWFQGYWWWVCPSGQSTAAQKFALWNVTSGASGTLIQNSVVTSGPLTAGQWNYVPLSTPVPLAIGTCYNATTGFTGSFPNTQNQFGSGDPYGSGIVAGPLPPTLTSPGHCHRRTKLRRVCSACRGATRQSTCPT